MQKKRISKKNGSKEICGKMIITKHRKRKGEQMAVFNDLESSEASITYNGGRLVVKNKKTGKSMYSRSFFSPATNYREKWKICRRELEEVSDSDIQLQICLNEEGKGGFVNYVLWGVPTEELLAEQEAREKESPIPAADSMREAMKVILKELGLPTYETLRRHMKKEMSLASA